MPLPLGLPNNISFDNFYPGDNHKIVHTLQTLPKTHANQFIFLWGKSGTGRSHLLMASCNSTGKYKLKSAYLNLRDMISEGPQVLENFEHMSLLCLDDIDAVLGMKDWEEAIFHCFNKLTATKGNLIITANASPFSLDFILPDLKSRLSSCLIFHIKPLNDDQKIQALILRSKKRGIYLPVITAKFLLNNYERDLGFLLSILEKLIAATLQEKRALTIPFAKEALKGS